MESEKHVTRNNFILFGLLVFACLMICIILTQLFINDCLWWECAPKRNFDVLDLNISSEISPEGTIYLLDDDNPTTRGTGFQIIYSKKLKDKGNYIVERYSKSARASEAYKWGLHLFQEFETKKPWERPSELSYDVYFADESIMGCGLGFKKDNYRCMFQARYEEFLVILNCRMEKDMTYQDFQEIIIFIDQRMGSLLET